jgi:hypothetical protein
VCERCRQALQGQQVRLRKGGQCLCADACRAQQVHGQQLQCAIKPADKRDVASTATAAAAAAAAAIAAAAAAAAAAWLPGAGNSCQLQARHLALQLQATHSSDASNGHATGIATACAACSWGARCHAQQQQLPGAEVQQDCTCCCSPQHNAGALLLLMGEVVLQAPPALRLLLAVWHASTLASCCRCRQQLAQRTQLHASWCHLHCGARCHCRCQQRWVAAAQAQGI